MLKLGAAGVLEDFLAAAGLISVVDWGAWSSSGRAYHGIDNVLYRPPSERKVSAITRLHFGDPVQLPHGRLVFASDHMGIEVELEWESTYLSSCRELRAKGPGQRPGPSAKFVR
jgi:hypothetical protein